MKPPALINEPAGCAACAETGYRGRLPLIEILEVDETIREHIRAGDVESFVDERPALDTLLGHGLALVAEGRTSLAEVERAVQLG
jgi:type II secretory ATPase GspE/PulE/Tfp pilus assembly ATPase PilB-like protein